MKEGRAPEKDFFFNIYVLITSGKREKRSEYHYLHACIHACIHTCIYMHTYVSMSEMRYVCMYVEKDFFFNIYVLITSEKRKKRFEYHYTYV